MNDATKAGQASEALSDEALTALWVDWAFRKVGGHLALMRLSIAADRALRAPAVPAQSACRRNGAMPLRCCCVIPNWQTAQRSKPCLRHQPRRPQRQQPSQLRTSSTGTRACPSRHTGFKWTPTTTATSRRSVCCRPSQHQQREASRQVGTHPDLARCIRQTISR